jgi:peptide/nickel transport system substrate-binding protein
LWVVAVVLITSFVVLQVSLLEPAEGETTPSRVLRFAEPAPWLIDPAVGSDLTSTSAIINLYDPLVFPQTVAEGSGVKPWIATNWTSSADGLTWTFTIRQGVTFHSGRELNATDVAFSMNRLLTIGEGYSYLFTPYVISAVATDPWTVVFQLSKPFAPFLLCLVRLWILDSSTVIAHEASGPYGANGDYGMAWLDLNDAGSGPFTVKENSPGAFLDMIFYSKYWGYVAPLHPTEMILVAEPTPATELSLMMTDQLEISSPWLTDLQYETLNGTNGIYIANVPEPDEYYYMMNTQKPPLDDVHVRMALAYCLNYTDLIQTLYPLSTVATSCVPASVAGYLDCSPYYYNLTMAKYELSLSKYANNISDYPIDFDWTLEVPIRQLDAEYFASCAAQIGITVNVVSEPWPKFMADVTSPATSPGMASVEVDSDYTEAGSLLQDRYSSASMGTWENMEWLNDSTYDSLLEQALGTLNQTQRYALYGQLQQYIMNLCPSMFIYDCTMTCAVQSYVRWPMANVSQSVPAMGYNYDGRLIEIVGVNHDVAVTSVTADRPWVYQGWTANINVTVLDDGGFPENATVTLYYNITAGDVAGTQTVALASGESATLPFAWNTTGVPTSYANYTLTAVVTIPTGSNALSDGTMQVRIMGDINGEGVVNMNDIMTIVSAFGSYPGHPRWNPDCDLNQKGRVDLSDIVEALMNYGKSS